MTNFNHLYIVGDQNFESSRSSNHAKIVKRWTNDTQLCDLWSDFKIDFTYSFESETGNSSYKILDHIFAIRRSKDLVIDAGVLHLCENTSDHEVTYAKIEVSGEIVKVEHETVNLPPKLDWKAASNDQKLVMLNAIMMIIRNKLMSMCIIFLVV